MTKPTGGSAGRALVRIAFLAILACGCPGRLLASDPDHVREAMMRLYIHGVTEPVAKQFLEPSDVAILRAFLKDPDFPRRDNVVAFLGQMDDGSATDDLIAFLADPPADPSIPEEDRALLTAPQALGQIAGRGDPRALEALLAMTDPSGSGRTLAGAAARAADPVSYLADLVEMALRGLGWSGLPAAGKRLQEIADGPGWSIAARDLRPAARRALRIHADTAAPPGGSPASGAPTGGSLPALSGPDGSSSLSRIGDAPAALFDTSLIAHELEITWDNHVSHNDPMLIPRVDAVLIGGSVRAGRLDVADDVVCCIALTRSGSGGVFGTPGDGLDIIDDDLELSAVLSTPGARVKVVRQINWCGPTGPSIIYGCASGSTYAVVRLSNLAIEEILWLHELGHNAGLGHSGDSRDIMYPLVDQGNNLLTQVECDAYHAPPAFSNLFPVEAGACEDLDGDQVHDALDNCPGLSNFDQADSELDRIGDPCDPDDDNDLVDDLEDCRPTDATVWGVPGEVMPITVTTDPMGTLISWSLPGEPGGTAGATHYDTLQAFSGNGFDPGPPACLESNDGPDTVATTSAPPLPVWEAEGNSLSGRFGASVALAGDVNNDTWPDLIVGLPGYANGQDLEGRAMLFLGSDMGPQGPAWLVESNFEVARLGTSVAGGGDVNGDGFDDVAVGAPQWDDGATRIGGVVRVHHGTGSGLSTVPSWEEDGGTGNMQFGASVAFAGDIDGDGYDDLIVGAPFLFVTLSSQGTARVYRGSAGGLLTTPEAWNPVGAAAGAKLGTSVAGAGDVNDDGYDDVIVGASGQAMGQTAEGVAYVYLGSASGLSMTPQAVLQADQASAAFGGAVAGAGDVNGDGYDDVIVGAKEFDIDQSNEGAAFVFYGSPSGIDPTLGTPLEGDKGNADFGIAVASAGDYNNDGYGDLLVGAATTNNGLSNAGRTYLYLGSPQGPVLFQVIEGEQAGAQMGGAVSPAGDVNVDGYDDFVSAEPFYSNGQMSEGRVQIFAGFPGPDPPVGSVFYYLVRAENACGQGTHGFDSNDVPRTAPDCPLP